MKRTRLIAPLIAALLLGLSLPAARSVFSAQEKLTADEKTWLEDVSPILTKTEREVFLKLRTGPERQKFIHFFWRMRDTAPDTSENEFEKEYYARIRFADQNFGHYSPKRGSQTDRGFFYVLLGAPLERQQFTTQSEIWPLELWFYKGAQEYGLPDYFYLIFYQPDGIGDFRLYSPSVEGPEKLVMPQNFSGAIKRNDAVQTIRKINAELASAARSYVPGDNPQGFGSSASDILLADVRALPEKEFSDAYARSYLSFKDFVQTEYSDNYISSAFRIDVLREGGQPFIHWAIEPEKMNFASTGDTIYASFELTLRIENAKGLTILERTEEIPLKITPEQYKAHERRRFAFEDLLPLVPGDYKALFLLKNKTGRDFSSFETPLAIAAGGSARLSAPVLFHSRAAIPDAVRANLKAFAFDGFQYVVGARSEFLPAEQMGLYVQAWDLDRLKLAAPPSFTVELFSLDTNSSLGTFPLSDVKSPANGAGMLAVTGTISLSGVKPGYYRAEVAALAPDGRKLLSEKANFVVLAQAAPVVPWIYARMHGPFPGPEHLRTLGTEYFLSGDYRRAQVAFGSALQARDDPATRLLLAKALYGLGRYDASLKEALTVYERVPDRETGKVIALDYAGLKDWTSCLTYLEKFMAEATEVSVLNLAAECHLNLGRPDRALPLIQKSLALLPDQPAVKALEASAQKQLEKK